MPSVKKNFLYSFALTSVNYIVPLLVFPYVSRILGVSNIGICDFVDSVINYFVLFSMMGISTLGIREIASAGKNREKRSRVFSSLFLLNAITTTFAIFILLIAVQMVGSLKEYKEMFYIGAVKLCFNFCLIEWLYKGVEDFRFITIRSVIIRILYCISVFIFVRERNDYGIYFLLTTLTIVVNAVINLLYSRKFVQFTFKGLCIKKYIIPFVILGCYLLITSMYTTFNVAYLGFVSDKVEVGLYSTSHKLYALILSVFTAFTGVMMPHMSSLLAEGKVNEFKLYISKSFSILCSLSIPVIIVGVFLGGEIIRLFAGPEYEGAILPFKLAMPMLLIVGLEQILIVQVLTPAKKDKNILINAGLGAVVGVLLNVLLDKQFGAIGATITWIASEIVVLISAGIAVKKRVGISLNYNRFLKTLFSYIPSICLSLLICAFSHAFIVKIALIVLVNTIYTFIVQVLYLKDPFIIGIINKYLRISRKY